MKPKKVSRVEKMLETYLKHSGQSQSVNMKLFMRIWRHDRIANFMIYIFIGILLAAIVWNFLPVDTRDYPLIDRASVIGVLAVLFGIIFVGLIKIHAVHDSKYDTEIVVHLNLLRDMRKFKKFYGFNPFGCDGVSALESKVNRALGERALKIQRCRYIRKLELIGKLTDAFQIGNTFVTTTSYDDLLRGSKESTTVAS